LQLTWRVEMNQPENLAAAYSIEERFFYHSFPRRGRDTAAEIDKGCMVLALMRDAGLLLTPEIVEWQYPHADASPPRVERILQKRVCFTELAPRELPGHAREFGHFSLEFKVAIVRQLGGIPVFYVPRPDKAAGTSLEDLGSILVIQLMDARNLVNHIAHLMNIFDTQQVAEHLDVNVNYIENPSNQGQFTLASAEAKKTLQAVTHGVTPPSMLAEGINGMLNLFYPADDLHHNQALAYYRQREWRITGNLALHGQNIMRSPEQNEIVGLQNVDAEFFGRELNAPLGKVQLLNECLVYPGLGGKRMMELVNRVIVPAKAVENAKAILKDLNQPPPIVSLESLIGTKPA
jgi:hypothetical protein